jgi:hypothetical protein
MKADALEIDAAGLPLFRPDPDVAPSSIDVTTALRLEQSVLALQGLEGCPQEWASPEDEQAFANL